MDEDGAAFQATLAFLSEFDVAIDEPDGGDANTGSGQRTAVNRRNSKRSSSSIASGSLVPPKTKKEELEYLRALVLELEERLRQFKPDTVPSTSTQKPQPFGEWALADLRAQPFPTRVHSDADQVPQRIPSMWEELAGRQYQQRQRAEIENGKLKAMLEDQLKQIKSLQRMLQRHPHKELLPPPLHTKRRASAIKHEDASSTATVDEQASIVRWQPPSNHFHHQTDRATGP